MKVANTACGSGIYTRKMIDKGVFVYAFDYAESCINLTKKNNNFPSSLLVQESH